MRFNKIQNQGFTVLEAVVAMAGMLLLIIAGIDLYLFSSRSKAIIWEQLSTQNEGRKIVQDFSEEVRKMNYSSLGAYPLERAEGNHITFFSNIDTDSYRERIRYWLSGSILKKGVLKPSGNPLSYNPLNEQVTDVVHDVANVTDPIFYYYNEDFTFATGTPLTSPVDVTKVRVIKVNLLLEEDPTNSPLPFSIESKVQIRNLKTN